MLRDLSQGEAAHRYGVSQGWISRLLAQYLAEGEAAFEPRSRRPRTSPNATAPGTAELIVRLRKDRAGQGMDAGPQTIAWHLEHHRQVKVSAATGIGRTHARTCVLLIQDLHIRVINAATGELLRELVLDPSRSYQPTGRPPGGRRKP